MKLLFIYYDGADYYGGPIVHARRLLPELCRRGFEVHCLFLQFDDAAPSAAYLARQGIRCTLRPFSRYAEDHVRWILRQVSLIQPDVFVPNLSVAGFYAARWVRRAGIPTVAVHYSDDDFHRDLVEQFVCGDPEWAVSCLVCVSNELREQTERKRPKRTSVRTIPQGVPVPARHSLQDGPLKIVYVGRLNQRQKRIHDLIDALARLFGARKDMTAALIGSGKEAAAVRERIDHHGLNGRIRLLGTIPGEEIQSALMQYHVLVLLSDFEGTPIAVMDAMAAGLVPVCLDIPGGVRELVLHEQTGLLVRDRGEDFVSAVSRLADNPALRRQLAANARAHVSAHFSVQTAADQWESLCRELVQGNGRRTAIEMPWKLSLPPSRAGFSREDRRRPSLAKRISRTLTRVLTLSRTTPRADGE